LKGGTVHAEENGPMGRKNTHSEFLDRYKRLLFQNLTHWSPLPGWLLFYLELGASLTNFHEEKVKYVAALALPTRSFAANFIGSGFSYASTFLHPDEDANHLEQILSLPDGTPVKYRDNGKIKNAFKREIVNNDGKVLIGLTIEAEGKKTIYIDCSKANRIELTEKEIKALPLHQKGRDIQPPSDLVQELFQEKADEYVFRTRVDGITVGSAAGLNQEAQAELGIKTEEGNIQKGGLFELFRAEGFNPASTGHRFLVQPTNIQEPTPLPPQLPHHAAVIFDGALSFVKWKDYFSRHNWIVILDHTAPNFENAVSALNQECAFRSIEKLPLTTPLIPSGVEMMLFGRDI
jgi:hypothetical protein